MENNNNPLSPHLQVYRWHISSLLSITHRIVSIINFLNEIRHLAWDMGYGFDLKVSRITGIATIFGSFVLAILFYFIGKNII